MSLNRPREILSSFPGFVRFVFRNFPLAYPSTGLMLLGVVAEYAALSLMIPLSTSATGSKGEANSGVLAIWQAMVDKVGLLDRPQTWIWLFLLALALRILIGLLQIVLNTIVARQIHARLSASTFASVVSQVPMHEIYKRSVGHYMALAGDDSIRVGQLFFSLVQTLSSLLSASIGLVVLYLYSWKILLLTAAFLVICAAALSFLMRRVLYLSSQSGVLAREAVTIFVEVLNGLRSIRSMAAEFYVNKQYDGSVNRYARTLLSIDLYNHLSKTVPGLLLLTGALLILLPNSGVGEGVSVTYFLTVTTMLVRILSFLGVAVYSGGRAAVDIRAVFDLQHIIALPTQVPGRDGQRPLPHVSRIDLQDISCGYVAGRPVLIHVDLQLEAGRSYALVGSSGSGKSTLSDVLLGLLPPTAGTVEVAGVGYEHLDMSSLRRKVVLVEQQTRIFSGSVRENVAFGLSATDAEVASALQIAGLEEFLKSLPNGLETRLDYQGANISGGQRQRIGLARAILRHPDVLILDEATSALDAPTRDQVTHNLRRTFRDGILLFITHDAHVIDQVDEVWRIADGTLTARPAELQP